MTLNNWLTQAIDKLKDGEKGVTGQKEKVMAGPVAAQLENFCRQDEEFSQAVVQGGTFQDCMKHVASGVGSSISDLEAYKKAVQFYFPGAEVEMKLTIDLIGKDAGGFETVEETIPASNVISLNLEDFFG